MKTPGSRSSAPLQPTVFYGWVIVGVSAVGLSLGAFPIVLQTFGVFLRPLAQEFRAGRAAISLAHTIFDLTNAVVSVLIGRLCDRFGARKIILPGLIILGTVLALAKTIGSHLWQLYMFYAVLGVLTPATTSVPYGFVVSRWFNRRRGLALGLTMAGIGLGAFMPLLAQKLIAAFGWRTAFAMLGCLVLLVPTPIVSAFLKETPQQMRLQADGDLEPIGAGPAEYESEGLLWPEVWRSGAFWLILTATALLTASVAGCVNHMPAMFGDRGASLKVAALASSMAGLGLFAGRIACGYFLDRCFAPYVAAAGCASAASGMAVLWAGNASALALGGAFIIGLGFGTETDVMAFLLSRYFGLRSFGAAFGFAFGVLIIAGGLGVFLMGIAYDHTSSYRAPLAGGFVLTLAAAALFTRLGPYRYSAGPDGEGTLQLRRR